MNLTKQAKGGGEREGREEAHVWVSARPGPGCTRKMRCLRSDCSILSGALIGDLRCPVLNADGWAGPGGALHEKYQEEEEEEGL